MAKLDKLDGLMVRAFRNRLGWSQKTLAKEAGVSRPVIGGLEGGDQNLTFSKLAAIAKVLGVSVKDFIK